MPLAELLRDHDPVLTRGEGCTRQAAFTCLLSLAPVKEPEKRRGTAATTCHSPWRTEWWLRHTLFVMGKVTGPVSTLFASLLGGLNQKLGTSGCGVESGESRVRGGRARGAAPTRGSLSSVT